MPISRTELIARGLAQAGRATGNSIPITTMLDNMHFHALDPVEKSNVIARYAELVDVDQIKTPSLGKYVRSGVGEGLLYSLPIILGAGLLTLPPGDILKRVKSMKALKNVARRVARPMILAGGLASMAGAVSGMYRHGSDKNSNQFLERVIHSIQQEPNEDYKRIHAASLLSIAPEMSKARTAGAQEARGHMTQLIHPYLTKDRFREMIPPNVIRVPANVVDEQGRPIMENGKQRQQMIEVLQHYDEWRAVAGLESLNPNKGNE